ncbi:MAG: hypothetical protein IPK03_17455 [Bacteroidetes bacterium]|nr:hypothetical protein [Bacteroidota bacterium]
MLGFQIDYPKTWTVNSVDDYYANLDKIKLQDSAFDNMIKKSASIPFLFISKYKEPYEDLNPSIKINTRPYGNLKGKSLTEILNIIIPQFEKLFANFKVQEGPIEIKLDGITATYIKFYYSLKTKEGKEYLSCSEMYMIDKGNYYYMIESAQKQDESNLKDPKFRDILKTIKLN